MSAGALTIAVAALLGAVQLRGGVRIDAPIEEVTREGVRLGGEAPRMIGWDRVLRVDEEHREAAEQYKAVADAAWRARTRLARGDVRLAEPLFEELFESYRDSAGPTSLVVAEGLLRCRLSRGAQAAAVAPWLETLRIRATGESLAGEPPLPPAIDEETGLAPALPPVWLDTPSLETILRRPAAEEDEEANGEDADLAQALRAWTRYAAALERGDAGPAPIVTMDEHPGVALVRAMALSRSPDAETRAAAREELLDGLDADAGGWREAWRRAAIGRSLLLEPQRDQRMRGVLHLLHLPTRFGSSQPWLAGVALAEASLALADLGDEAGAATLQEELRRFDAAHPALDWLRRRQNISSNGRASARSARSMHADS